MCTSATRRVRIPRAPLIGAAVCAVAAYVYQLFGHGVTSQRMSLCFLPPLGCALLEMLWSLFATKPLSKAGGALLRAGVTTLAAWMFLCGVMEIAGAESPYLSWFLIAGTAECGVGLVLAGIT